MKNEYKPENKTELNNICIRLGTILNKYYIDNLPISI